MPLNNIPSAQVRYPPGRHPNSLKNLKPFPPGTNGYTIHQNKGMSLTARLRHLLDEEEADLASKVTRAQRLAYSTIEGAILREPVPFREVWDRVEGKVADRHEMNIIEKVMNIVFVLPSGTKVTPKELAEGQTHDS